MAIFTKQEFQTIPYYRARSKSYAVLNESRIFLGIHQKQVFSCLIPIMIKH